MNRNALIDIAAATKILGVSRNTLYAYVSRGLVRSTPHPDAPKASLYVASDIHALVQRKSRLRRPRTAAATALDFGLPVLKTHLTHFEDDHVFYRNTDAIVLSRTATLEDTARLLWNTGDDDPFAGLIFDPAAVAGWKETMTRFATARATDRASALLPLLMVQDNPYAGRKGAAGTQAAARLLLAVAAAATGRATPARSPVHKMIATALGKPRAADLIRRTLVLLADHELNPSTFTVRVVASTGARHTNCVLGGLAALSGPKHGAASEHARSFMAQVASPRDAARVVGERLDHGDLIPGFGHSVYRTGDPRAAELLSLMKPDPIARAILDAVREMADIEPNIDPHGGCLYERPHSGRVRYRSLLYRPLVPRRPSLLTR
jgi:citrate synthase